MPAVEADRNVMKQVTPEIKEINERDLTMNVIMTTKAKDRDGDIIEPTGVDMRNFMKNPVLLWAHDSRTPPIGKIVSHQIFEDKIEAKVQFADTDFGKEIFKLYKEKFMNAFSIGFLYKKGGLTKITDDEGNTIGWHVTAVELLELSAVPVPANPEALMKHLKECEYKTVVLDDGAVKEKDVKKSLFRIDTDGVISSEGWIYSSDLGKSAFVKTLHERVMAGKTPTEFDPELVGGFTEFEIIKEVDGVITEARITRVVLGTKVPTPEEDAGDEGEEETQNTTQKKVAVKSSKELRLTYLRMKQRMVEL